MPDQSPQVTPYDQFNFRDPAEVPQAGYFRGCGKRDRQQRTWTDANPMLNLSSVRDDLL